MMMIPVKVIAFFIAMLLLPAGVHQFTIDMQGKTTQWTKTADSTWRAVELPATDAGVYSVTNTTVTVRQDGKESITDVSKFLKIESRADRSKLEQLELANAFHGPPIHIRRETGRIILSQDKGGWFEKPVTISWESNEN